MEPVSSRHETHCTRIRYVTKSPALASIQFTGVIINVGQIGYNNLMTVIAMVIITVVMIDEYDCDVEPDNDDDDMADDNNNKNYMET